MSGISGVTFCQRGQINVWQFRNAAPISADNLKSSNNRELLQFVEGKRSYRGKLPRRIAYILDSPNIYLGNGHMQTISRHPQLDIEWVSRRLADSKAPPLVMGWLCVCDLPRGRSVDKKALGLSKKNRKVLFVDGFSDLFRSISPSRVSKHYYTRQTGALAFFPSILSRYQTPYPAVLIEQFSANQELRVSHISRQKAWKIVRNGHLLELESGKPQSTG
jgi:hypothetical protein